MTAPLPDASSDEVLIAAWQLGDERAAAELVRRHGRAVASYLAAGGAGDDVEDLVQEAFFRAFRKIDTFRGVASFRTWVTVIAGNVLKDLRRRRRGRVVLSLEEEDVSNPGDDPHGDAVAAETVRRLEAALRRLPPLQRDVFLLRVQQDASYEAIAEALDTTPGAARVHYHHAARRLRAALEETNR